MRLRPRGSVRRVGVGGRGVAALVDAGGRGSTAAPDARAVAEAVAAAQAEHERAFNASSETTPRNCAPRGPRGGPRRARAAEAERTARRGASARQA